MNAANPLGAWGRSVISLAGAGADAAAHTTGGWMSDWHINEGLPQCPSGFTSVSLTTSYDTQLGSQTAHLYAT